MLWKCIPFPESQEKGNDPHNVVDSTLEMNEDEEMTPIESKDEDIGFPDTRVATCKEVLSDTITRRRDDRQDPAQYKRAVSRSVPLTIAVGEDDYDVNPAAESEDLLFFPHTPGKVNLRKY